MTRRNSSRRQRPPMQWVPKVANATLTTVTNVGVILVDASAGEAAQVPLIARMTVNRVIGELHIMAGAGGGIVGAGIAVVNKDTIANFALNPLLQDDLDYPWMWRTSWRLESSASGRDSYINDFAMPHGPFVDCPQKRKLLPGNVLMLFIQNNTTATLTYDLYLRSLISRVA